MKAKWKLIMIDGFVQKISTFSDVNTDDDISTIRSWMNGTRSFISVGNNEILNLRYVKRIKRIWRLRDHLPKFSKINFLHIIFVLYLMVIGYLILVGI